MTLQEFSKEYVSATFLGTGNNYIMPGKVNRVKGRIYYPLNAWGTFPFRFFFQNIVDSTFSAGEIGWANLKGGKWKIFSLRVGDGGGEIPDSHPENLLPLTFDGEKTKEIMPGECFTSDEITLTIPEHHSLLVEIEASGEDIPFTPDKGLAPCYIQKGDEWVKSCDFPQPVLVGVKRKVKEEITFFGDSITQGLGTFYDGQYLFWVARLARRIGRDYAIRNLGLGFGRMQDAAKDGIWLGKAKSSQTVFVCLGVNDILKQVQIGKDISVEESLLIHAKKTLELLQASGCRIVLLTVPPFSMENREAWEIVNQSLQNLPHDVLFDTAPIWGEAPPNQYRAKYSSTYGGNHPNNEGCLAMADALYERFFPEGEFRLT